ncbi:MAG: hypothetical protein V4561_07480 [Bacteroidota bacterium]
MSYFIESVLYLISSFLPVLMGIKRYTLFDKPTRFIFYLAITSFLGEVIALFCAIQYHNNLWVYNIVQILMTLILCFYYGNSIDLFKRKKLGLYIASISIIVWISSLLLVHSFFSINSTYLAYMGTITILMSIISMDNLIAQKSHSLYKIIYSPHFWFAWILLIYWCFSMIQWMIYKYYTVQTVNFKYIELSLTIITMLVNFGYTAVFFYYPKMLKKNAI